MVTKAQIVEAMQALPEDATPDDARTEIDRLEFIELVNSRIASARANTGITQDEMERRVASWFK
jgi:hypothetical protein